MTRHRPGSSIEGHVQPIAFPCGMVQRNAFCQIPNTQVRHKLEQLALYGKSPFAPAAGLHFTIRPIGIHLQTASGFSVGNSAIS